MLTRSLARRPSNLATMTLRTVRRTKKKECIATIIVSLVQREGNATRKMMARNWRKNATSTLDFAFVDDERGGKNGASEENFVGGVSLMLS